MNHRDVSQEQTRELPHILPCMLSSLGTCGALWVGTSPECAHVEKLPAYLDLGSFSSPGEL